MARYGIGKWADGAGSGASSVRGHGERTMNISLQPTRYRAADIGIGIVHLGLGAFVRAHIAVYLEKLLNRSQSPWGVCAANIRSNHTVVETLQAQEGRYTVAEYASEEQLTLRQVSCLREVLFAGHGETQLLLARLARPETRIVTLTVTEKGYFYDAAKGALRADAVEIQHDVAHPDQPQTAIGILVAALRVRWQSGQLPFTVLSCDNMPHNGAVTRTAVIDLARINAPALADWIAANVSFPSSMVDRIVPAVTDYTVDEITRQLHQSGASWTDHVPVACEAFSQWVIEDNFPAGRPPLEEVGVVMVDDVAPWEAMKLRMLNGSHSLLAYSGGLAGLPYVADCVAQPAYMSMLRRYMLDEAAATLDMPEGADLKQYASDLIQRFSNTSLRHKTLQIAMDGSQKIPQRWLDGARTLLNSGRMPRVTALGMAGWIRFLQGVDEGGRPIEVSDPMAEELQALARQNLPQRDKVLAFLNTPLFSRYSLASYDEFVTEIVAALAVIETEGVAAAMQRLDLPVS